MQGKTSRVSSYLLTTRFSTKDKGNFFRAQKVIIWGAVTTISHVRSLFWIPHLRRLSECVIRNCYGC